MNITVNLIYKHIRLIFLRKLFKINIKLDKSEYPVIQIISRHIESLQSTLYILDIIRIYK